MNFKIAFRNIFRNRRRSLPKRRPATLLRSGTAWARAGRRPRVSCRWPFEARRRVLRSTI